MAIVTRALAFGAQMSATERLRRAHVLINNDGSAAAAKGCTGSAAGAEAMQVRARSASLAAVPLSEQCNRPTLWTNQPLRPSIANHGLHFTHRGMQPGLTASSKSADGMQSTHNGARQAGRSAPLVPSRPHRGE